MHSNGRSRELHSEALPGKKALIVTTNGTSVRKYGYLDRVQKELEQAGVEYAVFPGIRPNPTDINVMDGAKAVKDNGCDFVIALGGGSVMDCSKCIALMAANEGDIWDYSLSASSIVESTKPGTHELFIGKVEAVHVDEEYLDAKGNILWDKMDLM